MNFYTYIYLDPRKKGPFTYREYTFEYEPFYVGKGKGDQWKVHLRESRIKFLDDINLNSKQKTLIEMIKFDKVEPIILKVKEGLTEREAFGLEILLISLIGRLDKKTGPLTNLTEGGEGISGWIPSEQTKQKLRISKTGKNNPQFGKRRTEKEKEILSQKLTGRILSQETKDKISKGNKGKKMSEESKKKISKSNKNPSNKTRQKMSESAKNKNPISEKTRQKLKESTIQQWRDETTRSKIISSLRGRICSEVTKKKISKKHKNKILSQETKDKISKSLKGRPSSFKGKTMSKEAIEKIRLKKIGTKDSDEVKKKKSIAIKKWWKKRREINASNI